jgi:hypothetical protein
MVHESPPTRALLHKGGGLGPGCAPIRVPPPLRGRARPQVRADPCSPAPGERARSQVRADPCSPFPAWEGSVPGARRSVFPRPCVGGRGPGCAPIRVPPPLGRGLGPRCTPVRVPPPLVGGLGPRCAPIRVPPPLRGRARPQVHADPCSPAPAWEGSAPGARRSVFPRPCGGGLGPRCAPVRVPPPLRGRGYRGRGLGGLRGGSE